MKRISTKWDGILRGTSVTYSSQRRTALSPINPAAVSPPTVGTSSDNGPPSSSSGGGGGQGGGGYGGGGSSNSFQDSSGSYSSTSPTGLFPTSYDNSSKFLMQDLSYDIQKKLKTAFYDPVNKRCTLCNETLVLPYGVHCNYIMHATRQAILERTLSGIMGPPELVPQLWWSRLNDGKRGYGRMRYLSHNSKSQRRRRIIFLLHFLLRRGIIRESLGIFKSQADSSSSSSSTTISSASQTASSGFSESSSSGGAMSFSASSYNFQRHEMVGDSVVKYLLPDRIAAMFPVSEGGVEGTAGQTGIGRISNLQHVIDSNEGLREVYDYLDLDHMIGFRLPNSKTKSDVVESLFGELQGFLWSMDVELGNEGGSLTIQFPISSEYRYLYAVVEHLLNEISHSVLIWAAESALDKASEFIKENYKAPEERMGGKRGGGATTNRSSPDNGGGPPPPSVPPPAFYTVRSALLNRMPTPKEKAQKLIQSQYPPPQNLPAPYLSRVGASGVTYKRKPPAFLSGAPITRVLKSSRQDYNKQMKSWFEHNKQLEEIARSAQGGGNNTDGFDEEEFYRVLDTAAASTSSSSSDNSGSSNRDVSGDLMSDMAAKDEQFERYFIALRKQGKQLGVKGFEDVLGGDGDSSARGDQTPGALIASSSHNDPLGAAKEEATRLAKQSIIAKGMKAQLLESFKLCAGPSELPFDDWLETLSNGLGGPAGDNKKTTSSRPSSTEGTASLLLCTTPTTDDVRQISLLNKTGMIITCDTDPFYTSSATTASS